VVFFILCVRDRDSDAIPFTGAMQFFLLFIGRPVETVQIEHSMKHIKEMFL
jgi:hypothetical protein